MVSKQIPRELVEDQNINNFEECELIHSQLRSLCFLPYLYVGYTFDLIKALALQKSQYESLNILRLYEEEFIPKPDNSNAKDLLDLWNLYDVDTPFQNGYDDDWQKTIKDCWLQHFQMRSNSLTDLLASAIRDDAKKVDYTLFRLQRFDCLKRVRVGLSRKPLMMQDLIQQQVSALIASIGSPTQFTGQQVGYSLMGGGFSVGGFLQEDEGNKINPIDIESSEDMNTIAVIQQQRRRDQIAEKCLIFCCKMSKAIEKIQEYQ
ncbi:hypothetical protein FGO68_gene10594 [Halteria grandinella]|uniref:Uncharacterized protein n=1 Tax=Halteria grandinella TaxID=5974 RepID=A0A8J8T535_HALGN|nr:hypothetical protein FGO68_gene10594 [Halteria grandinella]